MAAGIYPHPGSSIGPCQMTKVGTMGLAACEHVDCNYTRRRAEAPCSICGERIGYDRRYYIDPHNKDFDVHATCLEDS